MLGMNNSKKILQQHTTHSFGHGGYNYKMLQIMISNLFKRPCVIAKIGVHHSHKTYLRNEVRTWILGTSQFTEQFIIFTSTTKSSIYHPAGCMDWIWTCTRNTILLFAEVFGGCFNNILTCQKSARGQCKNRFLFLWWALNHICWKKPSFNPIWAGWVGK